MNANKIFVRVSLALFACLVMGVRSNSFKYLRYLGFDF